MSDTYSTGELAKLAGVSVRTVQYYDQRGILVPSELTEAGRRIYSDRDFTTAENDLFSKGDGDGFFHRTDKKVTG
ncbi:DNA-binding transcriptional MerR regulator [Streptococcus porcorum]|uniref:DNA-binding transcriptional MerR regulator n=1 Tax=Streptococcus porcorum TaxID=701526 RepID=A0ABV2JJI3_9STRE